MHFGGQGEGGAQGHFVLRRTGSHRRDRRGVCHVQILVF